MSLQAQIVPIEILTEHAEACDVRYCALCNVYWQREYEADNAARLEAERDQDAALDEYERAEIQRDMEVDDDWNPNDEIYPSRA